MDWADRAALAALIRLLPGRLRMIFAVAQRKAEDQVAEVEILTGWYDHCRRPSWITG